ncbi:hypothetical protein GCM10007216_08330 [Thalassobacillus devorans]|uniref:Small peptidoglycan-associated lipoprotein n=1 Tax=Thalassobacillus devorans TaxID=279813 RepID=A0ABQ1NLT8_9BACI|nr:hypothetical protein [Thalassobacillus devorans]NIK27745.1 hypothetical protein [Thalassobacillus devorans]GGC80144.1 hypothetical protein GCM10007216_08330 [Thalassobacillus devorans]
MTKLLLPVGLIFIMISGCFPEQKKIEVISANSNGYEVQLLTEEEDKDIDKAYMDAFLSFKNQHKQQPLEFFKSTASLYQVEEHINKLPAFLIRKEEKTVATITGERKSEEIVEQLMEIIK